MKINYIKANPTENKTILVLNEVDRQIQPAMAAELLKLDPDSEQVGFIEIPENPQAMLRLQMMGGEFCGNAAISAAAKVARDMELARGKETSLCIEVSGAEGTVECNIKAENDYYVGRVRLPVPLDIKKIKIDFQNESFHLSAVRLEGIVHIIFPAEKADDGYEAFAEPALRKWAAEFSEDAIGLLHFDEEKSEMRPLVYVKATDSMYWERGCASGTAAIGAYLANKCAENVTVPVKQPGGVITAAAEYSDSQISKLTVTGNVKFEVEATVEISI